MSDAKNQSVENLLNFFEKNGEGHALISDDAGHWAISCTGIQGFPSDPPEDLNTSFFIHAHEWKPTIREALEAFWDKCLAPKDEQPAGELDIESITTDGDTFIHGNNQLVDFVTGEPIHDFSKDQTEPQINILDMMSPDDPAQRVIDSIAVHFSDMSDRVDGVRESIDTRLERMEAAYRQWTDILTRHQTNLVEVIRAHTLRTENDYGRLNSASDTINTILLHISETMQKLANAANAPQ